MSLTPVDYWVVLEKQKKSSFVTAYACQFPHLESINKSCNVLSAYYVPRAVLGMIENIG